MDKKQKCQYSLLASTGPFQALKISENKENFVLGVILKFLVFRESVQKTNTFKLLSYYDKEKQQIIRFKKLKPKRCDIEAGSQLLTNIFHITSLRVNLVKSLLCFVRHTLQYCFHSIIQFDFSRVFIPLDSTLGFSGHLPCLDLQWHASYY